MLPAYQQLEAGLLPEAPIISDRSRDAAAEARPAPIQVVATFYHRSLTWDGQCCKMADGLTEYHPDQSGIIAVGVVGPWKLGDVLYVCGPSERCLLLEARDTGYLGWGNIDTSGADSMVLSGDSWPHTVKVSIREEL